MYSQCACQARVIQTNLQVPRDFLVLFLKNYIHTNR